RPGCPGPVPAHDPQAGPRRPREGGEGQMKNFTYHQPSSVAMALPLLDEQWGKTELLAGGTDLHDLQKEYVAQPDKVVSLTGIGGDFKAITLKVPSGNFPPSVSIGAGVKLVEFAAKEGV